MSFLTSAIEAQMATAVTLGVRVPQLIAGTMSARERHRMVAEKFQAMGESARDASWAAARVMANPSAFKNPAAAAAALTTIAAAASKPFHKRVKANAKRLTRSSRPKSR